MCIMPITVTKIFNQKVNDPTWPLNDSWSHICWGHKCNSTQVSLYPTPMEICQCVDIGQSDQSTSK